MPKPIDMKATLQYVAELAERATDGDATAADDLGELARSLARLLYGALYIADRPATPFRETVLRRGREKLDEMSRTFA